MSTKALIVSRGESATETIRSLSFSHGCEGLLSKPLGGTIIIRYIPG